MPNFMVRIEISYYYAGTYQNTIPYTFNNLESAGNFLKEAVQQVQGKEEIAIIVEMKQSS